MTDMPNVGKNLSWCALLPNFKKDSGKEAHFLANPFCSFPTLRGQLWGVTSQSTVYCRSVDMSDCIDEVQ